MIDQKCPLLQNKQQKSRESNQQQKKVGINKITTTQLLDFQIFKILEHSIIGF
jgi:hypothetical protein